MKVYDASSIRNVALVGHTGSGKTQLTSAILSDAGMVNRFGKVDDGTTVTLTAAPDAPSVVSGWSGCDSSNGDTCTVTLTQDTTVVPTFDVATPGTADLAVTVAGPGSGSSLLSAEIRHLGGALGRPRPEHAALASVEAEYVVYGVGIAPTPELAAAAGLSRMWKAG